MSAGDLGKEGSAASVQPSPLERALGSHLYLVPGTAERLGPLKEVVSSADSRSHLARGHLLQSTFGHQAESLISFCLFPVSQKGKRGQQS